MEQIHGAVAADLYTQTGAAKQKETQAGEQMQRVCVCASMKLMEAIGCTLAVNVNAEHRPAAVECLLQPDHHDCHEWRRLVRKY